MMKGEKGQALPLVLIAIAIGALVIPSFLIHTGTSLISSRVYAEEIKTQYAADSGAEQAIWNLKYGGLGDALADVGDNVSYQLGESINDLPVTVSVVKTAEPDYFSITSSAGSKTLNASVSINSTDSNVLSWNMD
jgi:hypothetical protein